MKLKKDELSIEKLSSSHAIENMYILLIAVSLISFSLVPFVGMGLFIDRVVGVTAITVTLISFAYTASLYGVKSKECWVWTILIFALIMVLAANLSDALGGGSTLYFILRFTSKPVIIAGIMLKLKTTGLDIDKKEITVVAITFLGWILLTIVSAILPAMEGGFDLQNDMYAIFAFAELFAVLLAMLVLLTISSKGWYFMACGFTLIAMGDIFHPLGFTYDLIYPGSPIRLLWYIGLLLGAYGAYQQRKEHLKMIAF